jgi:hypothetical protein
MHGFWLASGDFIEKLRKAEKGLQLLTSPTHHSQLPLHRMFVMGSTENAGVPLFPLPRRISGK